MSDQKVSHDALHEIGICDCAPGEANLQSRAQEIIADAVQRIAQSQIRLGKQLAEKGREIDRLQLLLDGKQANHGRLHPESPLICFHCGKRVPVAFNQCTNCKETAEQRLKEAQAENTSLRSGIATLRQYLDQATERLRQREHELAAWPILALPSPPKAQP